MPRSIVDHRTAWAIRCARYLPGGALVTINGTDCCPAVRKCVVAASSLKAAARIISNQVLYFGDGTRAIPIHALPMMDEFTYTGIEYALFTVFSCNPASETLVHISKKPRSSPKAYFGVVGKQLVEIFG